MVIESRDFTFHMFPKTQRFLIEEVDPCFPLTSDVDKEDGIEDNEDRQDRAMINLFLYNEDRQDRAEL